MTLLVVWAEKIIRILVTIGSAYGFVVLSSYFFRRFLLRKLALSKRELRRRIDTIFPLLHSLIKYVVVFFAAIIVLRELGVDATALLAGAGVVGLAVGFGAQTLVRDIVTGVFLLFEDTFSVDDVIQIGEITGKVEEITLRVTRIRLFSGALVTIPNGEISRVANYNRDFTRAVVEIGIDYTADVDLVSEVLEKVAQEYAENHPHLILEPPLVQRIVRFDPSAMVIRVSLKVLPQEHWEVERELLYLIKKALGREGIEMPYQKQVVYLRRV